MGVQVDKTRRDQFSPRVDLFPSLSRDAADFGNLAVFDRDISFEQFAAKTVGDVAAANHEVCIRGHGVSSRNWFCWRINWFCRRIMGSSRKLSTAASEAQGCISLTSGASELPCGLRSVASASSTVRTMNTTEAPNTQCGAFWSMIQPNNNGLTMPPRLKPVVTMPKARPAAPDGAALRTSMSREGAITPPRNPAMPIAVANSREGSVTLPMPSTMPPLTAKQPTAPSPLPP